MAVSDLETDNRPCLLQPAHFNSKRRRTSFQLPSVDIVARRVVSLCVADLLLATGLRDSVPITGDLGSSDDSDFSEANFAGSLMLTHEMLKKAQIIEVRGRTSATMSGGVNVATDIEDSPADIAIFLRKVLYSTLETWLRLLGYLCPRSPHADPGCKMTWKFIKVLSINLVVIVGAAIGGWIIRDTGKRLTF